MGSSASTSKIYLIFIVIETHAYEKWIVLSIARRDCGILLLSVSLTVLKFHWHLACDLRQTVHRYPATSRTCDPITKRTYVKEWRLLGPSWATVHQLFSSYQPLYLMSLSFSGKPFFSFFTSWWRKMSPLYPYVTANPWRLVKLRFS